MAPPSHFPIANDEEPSRATTTTTTAEAAKRFVIASPGDFFQELWRSSSSSSSPSTSSSSSSKNNSNSNSPDAAAAVAVKKVRKEEEENAAAADSPPSSSSIRRVDVIVHPTDHQRMETLPMRFTCRTKAGGRGEREREDEGVERRTTAPHQKPRAMKMKLQKTPMTKCRLRATQGDDGDDSLGAVVVREEGEEGEDETDEASSQNEDEDENDERSSGAIAGQEEGDNSSSFFATPAAEEQEKDDSPQRPTVHPSSPPFPPLTHMQARLLFITNLLNKRQKNPSPPESPPRNETTLRYYNCWERPRPPRSRRQRGGESVADKNEDKNKGKDKEPFKAWIRPGRPPPL
ncbi:uncharacterized protein BKA78DRAFT_298631 [Phyllosticta capitalensis]|uniref:uncharacterized protein n=1 Tax=Phyllosticta capitalensis TaxID=121624 RepID=UPI003130E045